MPKVNFLDKQALIYLVIRIIVTLIIVSTAALIFITRPLLDLGVPPILLGPITILIISPIILFIARFKAVDIGKIVFLEIIGAIIIQAILEPIANIEIFVPIAINIVYTYFVIIVIKNL